MSGWTIGSVWEETRAVVRAKSWVFAPIAAAFVLLPNLVAAFFFPDNRQSLMDMPSGQALAAQLAVALVSVIAEAAILLMVLRPDGDRSVGEIIGEGLRLTPALFVLKLTVGIVSAIGLLFLIVPAFYLFGRLGPAAPAMIAERLGIADALQRGWTLGRPHAWRIFLFFALILVGMLAAVFLLSVVAAAIGLIFKLLGINGVDHFLVLLTTAVALSLVTVYGWTGIAVIYRRIARG